MATIVLIVVVVVSLVGLIAGGGLLLQLVRQHGGVLLRLEALEQRLAALEGGDTAAQRPEGVSVGAALPPFRLPDFAGRTWGPEELSGEGLLLVHWSPACGFCEQIADELGTLAPAMSKHGTELALVSWGDVETNRRFAQEHGLRCPILLVDGSEALSPFSGLGTPVAYVLDRDRRVTRPLALGADEVLELASELAGRHRLRVQRPLGESRIERHGLAAGTAAPDFTLPDLDGGTVTLSALRGRRVLLVFSAPDCNPCAALAPQLERLRAEHGDELAVLVVSRGEADENRRKRDEQGVGYPIVLQTGWRTSREYGIFETPVGFLIDEEGVIARDVARGGDAILALADWAVRQDRGEVGPAQAAVPT